MLFLQLEVMETYNPLLVSSQLTGVLSTLPSSGNKRSSNTNMKGTAKRKYQPPPVVCVSPLPLMCVFFCVTNTVLWLSCVTITLVCYIVCTCVLKVQPHTQQSTVRSTSAGGRKVTTSSRRTKAVSFATSNQPHPQSSAPRKGYAPLESTLKWLSLASVTEHIMIHHDTWLHCNVYVPTHTA